jgi:hypothetical protein
MLGHCGHTQNNRHLSSLFPSVSYSECNTHSPLRSIPPITLLGGENLMENLGPPPQRGTRPYFLAVRPGIFPITISLKVCLHGGKSIALTAGGQ